MLRVRLRTIKTDLVLNLPDQSAFNTIRFIHADPEIAAFPATKFTIDCERVDGFLRTQLPSGYLCEGTSDYVLAELHRYHFSRSKHEFPDQILIHGGTITHDEQHTVIVGEKGSGKSTLLLSLGFRGLNVVADEHIFVRQQAGIARCRTLRIKEGSLDQLSAPERRQLENCAYVRDWHGSRIFSVSPRLLHGSWTLGQHPIRNIVFLDPNHGGKSHVRPVSQDRALELLMAGNIVLPDEGRLAALADLRNLLSTARLWRLRIGQLDACPSLIYEIL